jgi:hypothetical protein
LISCGDDRELSDIRATITGAIAVEGRADIETALCQLLADEPPSGPKTLDLIGHSTADTSLLVVGEWMIDATSLKVTAFFRELAEQNVLTRLGIQAVRLLGCSTAVTEHGHWTVCALADILGVEVYGTTAPLLASYYNSRGFSHDRRYLLTSAAELRSMITVTMPTSPAPRSGHVLDVDRLPALPLEQLRPWPVHVVNAEQARELLNLIDRREGSVAALGAVRCYELAFPSPGGNRYHRIEVLFDGEMVRVHTENGSESVVYPVSDPSTFRRLVTDASRR